MFSVKYFYVKRLYSEEDAFQHIFIWIPKVPSKVFFPPTWQAASGALLTTKNLWRGEITYINLCIRVRLNTLIIISFTA